MKKKEGTSTARVGKLRGVLAGAQSRGKKKGKKKDTAKGGSGLERRISS